MKESPQDKSLEQLLGASKFSGEGFLGTDHRPVNEIIADDLRTLDRRGISKDALVESLRSAYALGRAALGLEVKVQPGVTAVAHESMGYIPSPFRGDGVFEKGEVVIRTTNGTELILTDLGLALIEKHNFFQGRGARYRIDPARAATIFGLGKP